MYVRTVSGCYCNLSSCDAIAVRTLEDLNGNTHYAIYAAYSNRTDYTLCIYHTGSEAQAALDRMMELQTTKDVNFNSCYNIVTGCFIKHRCNI